jgi:DNA modification methylase
LFNGVAVSATNFNQELRLTKVQRLDEVVSIVKSKPGENFLIWVKHDAEGEYLRKLLPGAVEVSGSDKPEIKERRLLGFAKNEFPILITKMKIAAWGLNYQNCGNHIFASPDFSFEMVFQAIRRSLRFGRLLPVNAWILTTDTMTNVIKTFYRKQAAHEEMQQQMIEASKRKIHKKEKQKRKYMQVKGENFDIRLGDCVQLIKDIPDESIGFSVFSPPFAELYTYSDELEDMGNSKNYNEFLFAFKFLVKDLYRVLWSGRNIAVHCMDLPIQKGKEGYIGLRDFSNMIRESFEAEGFIYHSRVTIWKDPVTEMQRTKALGLLHKQVKKDAAMSRVGLPDYILVFRKPGEHKHPVKCDIPVDLWQKYASPVWYDIDYSKTLNGRSAREERDEKHICPLQLETIERCIHLWTNKGDTILTPFMGIGSEVFQALKMKRKGVGFELKKSYFDVAAKNCIAAEKQNAQKLLFD